MNREAKSKAGGGHSQSVQRVCQCSCSVSGWLLALPVCWVPAPSGPETICSESGSAELPGRLDVSGASGASARWKQGRGWWLHAQGPLTEGPGQIPNPGAERGTVSHQLLRVPWAVRAVRQRSRPFYKPPPNSTANGVWKLRLDHYRTKKQH